MAGRVEFCCFLPLFHQRRQKNTSLYYIEVLLYFRWEHSPLINDCPVLDSSGNIICTEAQGGQIVISLLFFTFRFLFFTFPFFVFYVSVFVLNVLIFSSSFCFLILVLILIFHFSVFVFNVLIFTSSFCFLVLVLILIFYFSVFVLNVLIFS